MCLSEAEAVPLPPPRVRARVPGCSRGGWLGGAAGARRGRVGSRTPSHGPFTPTLLSTEGFQSWMWRGLTFLLPFLFCGHVSPRGVCVYPLLWADPWEGKLLRPLPHQALWGPGRPRARATLA